MYPFLIPFPRLEDFAPLRPVSTDLWSARLEAWLPELRFVEGRLPSPVADMALPEGAKPQ